MITDADIDQVFSGVVDVVSGDLATVRTGRARPELVSHIPIKIESYGATMSLFEVASVSAPDSQTLTITPWDKNITGDILKGLSTSDLQLSPREDGGVIRIVIPPLTAERRQELTKLVDKKVESGKVLLREERKRLKQQVDSEKGKPGVSEDDLFKSVEDLDRKTREWEGKIDGLGEEKKKELMTL